MARKRSLQEDGFEIGRHCFDLATAVGEIGCAVEDVRMAAQHRSANALLMPLHHIARAAKSVAPQVGDAGVYARKLSSRAQRLEARIRTRALSHRALSDREADFFFQDAGIMWSYVRQLQDAASKACGSRPPGMVWPVEPFPPLPKSLGQ